MSRNRERDRDRKAPSRPTALDEARNELFSHIHRCGVLSATEDQQVEWMKDTVEFLSERYPSLKEKEIKELEGIGLRFCRPVIVNAPVAAEAAEPEAEMDVDAELGDEAEADVEAEAEPAAA
ncbi:hypothetical protein SAMN05216486_10358 [bacterium JGI 053]|nr:hypothetical protein SAMN05216486_10358 [bacterium JGI 053]